MPTEYIDNCSVTTYTLPHHTKCSSKEWNDHEGKEGYLANQGFYLYRNGRLISKATWFGLSKKLDMRKLNKINDLGFINTPILCLIIKLYPINLQNYHHLNLQHIFEIQKVNLIPRYD